MPHPPEDAPDHPRQVKESLSLHKPSGCKISRLPETRMRSYALRHSIGTKIFGAFLAMSIIIAGLGAYGYSMLQASGDIVADTYDHPMMAINFARAASVDFLQMENDTLRAAQSSPAQSAKLDKDIDSVASTLSDDLDVADERATANDERNVIHKIRSLVKTWQSA